MSDLKSLQELQDLIKEAELTKVENNDKFASTDNRVTHQFVQEMEISSGDCKIPTYLIYYNFIIWCRERYKRPCGNTEFFRTFKKYCQSKRNGNQRFYLLNENNKLNYTDEFNEKAKSYKEKSKPVSSIKSKTEPPVS